ncbi:MAG: hypothetical protein NTY48_04640 [Candidatus Diapherotrites archaeon]|nr:hypothetical protein [Candidatus Diapherotrites archaeon]
MPNGTPPPMMTGPQLLEAMAAQKMEAASKRAKQRYLEKKSAKHRDSNQLEFALELGLSTTATHTKEQLAQVSKAIALPKGSRRITGTDFYVENIDLKRMTITLTDLLGLRTFPIEEHLSSGEQVVTIPARTGNKRYVIKEVKGQRPTLIQFNSRAYEIIPVADLEKHGLLTGPGYSLSHGSNWKYRIGSEYLFEFTFPVKDKSGRLIAVKLIRNRAQKTSFGEHNVFVVDGPFSMQYVLGKNNSLVQKSGFLRNPHLYPEVLLWQK